MRALISAPYLVPYIERFRYLFEFHNVEIIVADVKERLEEDELIELLPGIDGMIAGDDRLTRRVLETTSSLKVLSKWGTGIDSFDQDAARELGIRIYNVPGAFSEPVADTVLGYILAFARNLYPMNRAMKAGAWEKVMGIALNEATVGIVGVGDVGKAVAQRLNGFGCKIVGNDIRTLTSQELNGMNIEMSDFSSLLQKSDFVSVNCDLNSTSYHLFNENAFGEMKSSAYIINCARGPIVDQKALVSALRAGGVAGAALDVFEHEPLESDSPLLNMDNVLLAPHNSNSSPTAWESTHRIAIENLFKGLGLQGRAEESL